MVQVLYSYLKVWGDLTNISYKFPPRYGISMICPFAMSSLVLAKNIGLSNDRNSVQKLFLKPTEV